MGTVPLLFLLAAGCATTEAGQGGAKFLESKVDAPRVSADAMYEICWAPHETGEVTLQFLKDGQVFFEAKDGASNNTGRCLREIAGSYPNAGAVGTSKVVKAPGKPASGWAWLEWARLLSASRYGPERGLMDAAPLVAACLEKKGMGLRTSAVFEIEPLPSYEVRTLATDGRPGAFTDTEHCVDAVLGSTVWPSSQPASFSFEKSGAPPADGDVSAYFLDSERQQPIDAQVVHDAFALIQPQVSACWEAALARRPGLGGGRTVRVRVDAAGKVMIAIAGNASQSGRTASDFLLDRCLVNAVKAVRLPGPGESVYSWVFASR
jgi:hypothetical protein